MNAPALKEKITEFAEAQKALSTADAQPIFSATELEQLAFRRFNPYQFLTAVTLSNALDAWEAGEIATAARIWARIAKSDPTIFTVKPKREEAVSLRPIGTRPKNDTPLAADQAAFLKHFYDNATASHATKRHVVGKSSLLIDQMMESIAYEYAAHHIIWKPNAGQPVDLPSGTKLPSLTATFEYVPLEFFEARTGELRFLGTENFVTGKPLPEFGDWMITTGPGLMFCACILHYFKRLFRHDGVNFSEKFGQPGTLVHTTALQNSEEGKAALKLAQTLASNYKGVIYGAAENKAEYIWPQGGVSGEGLVMHVLGLDIKKEMISLWMSADLSTQSSGPEVHGASIQGEDKEKRERRDCKRIGDSLNVSVDPVVLRWAFGYNAPILAEAFIDYPENEDRKDLRESVTTIVNGGGKVPIEPIAKRLNVPLAKEGEAVFEKAVAPAVDEDEEKKKPAINAVADMQRFLGPHYDAYFDALAGDLQTFRTAMETVLSPDDVAFNSKVRWMKSQLPSLLTEIIAAPKQVAPMAVIIRRNIEEGWKSAASQISTAEIAATAK